MPTISTHVLDTSRGRPASGVAVRLERDDDGPALLARAVTDADGRIREDFPQPVPAGRYRLVFETGAWFGRSGQATLYPEIVIHLRLEDSEPHYHVPLLLAPFSYSTYRGS